MFIDSARAREAKLISSSVRRPLPVASDEHVILQSMHKVAALGLACCWCSRSAGHTSKSQALHYLFMHEEGGDKRAETHLIIYLN